MDQNTNIRTNKETSTYVLSSTVEKAFAILEYIAANQPVMPSDITKTLELTRSNVHRLLATLVSTGYVIKNSDGYYLSFKLFHLGNSIPFSRDTKAIAEPFMNRLVNEVNENIYLNVLSGEMIIAIHQVKSDNHLVLNSEKVYTYSINSCASGKVFLSTLNEDSLSETINRLDMKKMTNHTITDRDELIKEIIKVKEQGYAVEIQEFSEDLNSVAAPVYDYRNQIAVSLSISGPASRLTLEKIELYSYTLLRTAADISAHLRK